MSNSQHLGMEAAAAAVARAQKVATSRPAGGGFLTNQQSGSLF